MKTKDKTMDKIPEKFLNSDGTLNSEMLVKSYTELEKKLNTMISIPTADDTPDIRQKFNRAIGVPETPSQYPTNELYDDENLRQKFFDIGLTSKQVEKIYDIANEFLTPIVSEIFSVQNQSSAINELRNFFGTEQKMIDALTAIESFGIRFLPHDAFVELSATAQGIQSIYKMMQTMEPSVHTDKNSNENLSDSDLRRMMQDPKYWRDNDTEYIRKIENGFKKLYS